MVIKKDAAIVYNILYNGGTLDSDTLRVNGINNYRVKKLLAEGLLANTDKAGYYKLSDVREYERYKESCSSNTEEILVMSPLEMTVFNLYLKNGFLTPKSLSEIGIDSNQINRLMYNGILQRIPDKVGFYRPVNALLLESYRREVKRHPELMRLAAPQMDKKTVRLCEIFVENGNLTEKGLIKGGFSKEEVRKLIDGGELVKLENGAYVLSNMFNIILYGKSLERQNRYEEAFACYNLAYKRDLKRSVFDEIMQHIILEKYQEALEYLKEIGGLEGTPYIKEYNFYLFLLSFLYILPTEFKKTVKGFKLEDLLISKENEVNGLDIDAVNEVRTLVYKLKFKSALEKLLALAGTMPNSKEEFVLKSSIQTIINKMTDFKTGLIEAIRHNRIREVEFLTKREILAHRVDSSTKYFYLIAHDIIVMRESQQSISPIGEEENTLLKCILSKRYKRAYELSLIKGRNSSIALDENYLSMLLDVARRTVALFDENPVDIISIIQEDFERGEKTLAEFYSKKLLNVRGLLDYEYLLTKEIELASFGEKRDFTRVASILMDIIKGTLIIDYDLYATWYLDELAKGNIEAANICIGIVREAIKKKHIEGTYEDLIKDLESMRKLYKNGAEINRIDLQPVDSNKNESAGSN